LTRRTFTPEFKAKVVLEVITGAKSAAAVCRQHNLKPQLLAGWKATLLQKTPLVFPSQEQRSPEQAHIAEWERLVGRLTLEMEIQKKSPICWGFPCAETRTGDEAGERVSDSTGLSGAGLSAQFL
jgi:transposase-like protein